jgi:putative toxin-antitoxin system antitoxin component (TIGR02293 family)
MVKTSNIHTKEGKVHKTLVGDKGVTVTKKRTSARQKQQKVNHTATQLNEFNVIKLLETNPDSDILIEEILDITGLSLRQLAKNVYEMTPKTLAAYKKSPKQLSTRSMEISIKLKMLYEKASQLFIEIKYFNGWLQKECPGLGGRIPITLLNTSTGIDLVYDELTRIEFGATA